MTIHDYLNVCRVYRRISAEWGRPVWTVKATIQGMIDRSWEIIQSDPTEKALWDTYFPQGKPATDPFFLLLGHAYKREEEIPYFLKEWE